MEDNLKTTQESGASLAFTYFTTQISHYKSLYTFHARRNKVITAEKTDDSKKVSNRPDQVFRVPNQKVIIVSHTSSKYHFKVTGKLAMLFS